MYKIEFTLKQHTPLIHFQHNQEGATLRATEVKPKLDRYLISNFEDFNEYKKFLIGYDEIDDKKYGIDYESKFDRLSFDYKLFIYANDSGNTFKKLSIQKKDDKWESDTFPFMLSNMGGKENKDDLKNFVFNKVVKIVIKSMHETLLIRIRDFIEYFLAIYNFGNRQNKGFGCFTLSTTTIEGFEKNLSELNEVVWKKRILDSEPKTQEDFLKIFKVLDRDYKKLKSGFGDEESKLKEYFEEKYEIIWEKSAIKYLYKGRSLDPKSKYLRILMGMADHFEFPQKNMDFKVNLKHLPEQYDAEIERFNSPLTFKLFNGTAYIIPELIPEEILGQRFQFHFESQRRTKMPDDFSLKTPNIDGINQVFVNFLNRNLIGYKKVKK